MSAQPPMNPDDGERLLAGLPVADHPRLARLLAEAAAPGQPDELAGLSAATAAFRESAAVTRGRRRGRVRRALLFKISAIAAATAVGGVAFAASTGVLPGPFFPHAPQASPGTAAASSSGHAPGTARPSASPSAAAPSLLPTVAAKVHKQCRSLLADPAKSKATTSPAYAELVAAAAGEDLAAFCTRLTAQPQPSPSPHRPGADPSKGPDKTHPSPTSHRPK
ncbi:hypothetical protein Cs7R123_20570 [Catellatospora sp. TT07R-123]|uniref:hypothetical protein n=1 Tax=Catellatospora sp. TT07R-123 TaxID=2733863 RepID=UPI001B14A1AA|nr:hypothetical protein [Catellatospora sp. TT07R-123]GHJ44715.1 hypothetical protein Cs7R123_20570 [Catellatospora sp. TT07R-123]